MNTYDCNEMSPEELSTTILVLTNIPEISEKFPDETSILKKYRNDERFELEAIQALKHIEKNLTQTLT